jgi:tryptophanyl-tRNA synthetase
MTDSNAFGLTPFTEEQLALFSFLPPHLRNILQFHRDADTIDFAKERYFIYTGRGPSKASLHIGHLPALRLCLALQKHCNTLIQFMIADDEKMIRDGIPDATMRENVTATVTQLYGLGFTPANTQFRVNSDGLSAADYGLIVRMMSMVSIHTLDSIFGPKRSVGDYFYPLIQILPCMASGARCIVVAGVDQDPFFRLARDIARRLGFPLPIILYTRSVPGLDGSDKMSTSVPESMPIYLSDTAAEIAAKVAKIRKVGAGSLEELFARGANLEADIPYQLLRFFDTSPHLPLIAKGYTTGLTDPDEKEELSGLVGARGVRERDGRLMLTSAGIRAYLAYALVTGI